MNHKRIDPQEREAMEAAAGGRGWRIDRERIWLAAREYSKQREEELQEALEKLSESSKQAQGIMSRAYRDEAERVGHLDAWLDEHCSLVESALAKNGDENNG